jgi:hypothetical protein
MTARHALSLKLTGTRLLDLQEFSTILLEVSAVINSRPLAIRVGSNGDFHSVSASDILLGRASRMRPRPADLEALNHENLVEPAFLHMTEITIAWWEAWVNQCFGEMVPRRAWKTKFINIQVGDVGHLKYQSGMGRPSWRLCRVVAVHPGDEGVVRTITVAYRSTVLGEKVLPYKTKNMTEMVIGVQRFALLYRVHNQEG